MLNLEIQIPFYKKKFPKKLLSRHKMQSNTLARREYKDKCIMNISKKSLQDPKQDTDPDTDPRPTVKQDQDPDQKKIIPDPQHSPIKWP